MYCKWSSYCIVIQLTTSKLSNLCQLYVSVLYVFVINRILLRGCSWFFVESFDFYFYWQDTYNMQIWCIISTNWWIEVAPKGNLIQITFFLYISLIESVTRLRDIGQFSPFASLRNFVFITCTHNCRCITSIGETFDLQISFAFLFRSAVVIELHNNAVKETVL
mgnify:CR=1 FL=1